MFGPNSSSSIASATDHLRTPEQGRLARTTCRYHLPLSDCESHRYQTNFFVPTETQETMIETTTYSRLPFPYTASTVFESYLCSYGLRSTSPRQRTTHLDVLASWICWNRFTLG
jgi:hypothetical protein